MHRLLPIRRLPSSLVGRSLIHLSDIHVGGVDDDYVTSVFRQLAELQPDIVVITGDFMTCHKGAFKRVESVYKHFPTGRLATLAIPGNHDYGQNWAHPEMADRLVDIVSKLGIRVLRIEVHEVDGLRIVGLDDLLAKQFGHAQGEASCGLVVVASFSSEP